jgi:hypothetical protein
VLARRCKYERKETLLESVNMIDSPLNRMLVEGRGERAGLALGRLNEMKVLAVRRSIEKVQLGVS